MKKSSNQFAINNATTTTISDDTINQSQQHQLSSYNNMILDLHKHNSSDSNSSNNKSVNCHYYDDGPTNHSTITTTATTTTATTTNTTATTTNIATVRQSKGLKDHTMNGGKNYYYDDQLKSFVYNIRQRRQALRLTQERAAQSFRAYTNNNLPYSDHIISYIETFAIAPDKVRKLMHQLSSWITYIENEVSNGQTLKFCASQNSMLNLNNNNSINITNNNNNNNNNNINGLSSSLSPITSLTLSNDHSINQIVNNNYNNKNNNNDSTCKALALNQDVYNGKRFEETINTTDFHMRLSEVALASTLAGINASTSEFVSPTIQAQQNLNIFSKLMLQASMLNNVQTNLNSNRNISGPSSPNLSYSSYLSGQGLNDTNDMSIASINLAQITNKNNKVNTDDLTINNNRKLLIKKGSSSKLTDVNGHDKSNNNNIRDDYSNTRSPLDSPDRSNGFLDLSSRKLTSTKKNNNNNHKECANNNIFNNSIRQEQLTSNTGNKNVIKNDRYNANLMMISSSRLSPDCKNLSDSFNNLTSSNHHNQQQQQQQQQQTNQDGALNLSVNHRLSFSSSSATGSSVSSSISNVSRARSSSSSSLDTGDTEDLDKIRAFIEDFKSRRGALGLTQKQAAQCFRSYTNDRFAFSDNFVGHFEGFQFRPQTAMTIADSLSEWLEFAEKETREGRQLMFMQGRVKETRKRKYEVIRIRDSAKKILVEAFEENRSPSTNDLESLSNQTGIPTRNIEIWFKNRRTSTQYRTY